MLLKENQSNNLSTYIRTRQIDISGSTLKTIRFEDQVPGDHDITIDLSDLPAGMYFVRMQSGDDVSMRKIVKQ